MKTKHTLLIVIIFVLAFTAACGGGTATSAPPADVPTEVPTEAPVEVPVEEPTIEPATEAPTEEPAQAPTEVPTEEPVAAPEFPLPDDAGNVMVIGEGATSFQTGLSIPDVVTFYRFAFPDYTEREILTVVEEGIFNLVFDGHPSGQAIVIQGFPMGEGVVNVSIRLEAE